MIPSLYGGVIYLNIFFHIICCYALYIHKYIQIFETRTSGTTTLLVYEVGIGPTRVLSGIGGSFQGIEIFIGEQEFCYLINLFCC